MEYGGLFALGGIWLVGVIAGLLLYFIPSIVAFKKRRDNKISILLLNIFLGWSLIGWVVALVWAFKEA